MLWVKTFHIVAVVCWFAMLFYLPRLFVYHAMAEDQISKDRFCIMERKLYRGIGTPSMIATLIFGFWFASTNWAYYSASSWFWIKVFLVAILVGYHHMCGRYIKQFQQQAVIKNHVFFRWFNEFPVILLIAIIALVVVRPEL